MTLHKPLTHELPEVIGEFIGWRAWNVIRAGNMYRLQSLGTGAPHYGCVWTPGKMMQAICDRNNERTAATSCVKADDERAPGENCSCGFYSATERDRFADMPYSKYGTGCYGADSEYMKGKVARVMGRVALAGKVIPGTEGWRSQYAWPVEIFVPYEHTALCEVLTNTYHVPVRLANWINPLKKGQ